MNILLKAKLLRLLTQLIEDIGVQTAEYLLNTLQIYTITTEVYHLHTEKEGKQDCNEEDILDVERRPEADAAHASIFQLIEGYHFLYYY